MERTYEIKATEHGYRLSVIQDGIEIAGAAAGDTEDDYDFLLEQAHAICGTD